MDDFFMWSHLGLNQGPPDYESGATNQLSYRTPLVRQYLSYRNQLFQTMNRQNTNEFRLQRYCFFLKYQRKTKKKAKKSIFGCKYTKKMLSLHVI